MRAKRMTIWLLAGVNLALLAGLVLLSYELPEAYAQRAGRSSPYITVTAQYTGGTDALCILQRDKHIMTVLLPELDESGRLFVADSRDVAADLGG